jgi:hypothetical protein
VRILKHETSSFFQRIRWLLETELYRRGPRLNFVVQLGLTPKESTRAQGACNDDSNSLFARFPWATLADDRILVEAWAMGAAWAYRNARSAPSSSEQVAGDSPTSSDREFYREAGELARQVQLHSEHVFALLRKSVPPLLTPDTSLQTVDWTSLSFQAPESSNPDQKAPVAECEANRISEQETLSALTQKPLGDSPKV